MKEWDEEIGELEEETVGSYGDLHKRNLHFINCLSLFVGN